MAKLSLTRNVEKVSRPLDIQTFNVTSLLFFSFRDDFFAEGRFGRVEVVLFHASSFPRRYEASTQQQQQQPLFTAAAKRGQQQLQNVSHSAAVAESLQSVLFPETSTTSTTSASFEPVVLGFERDAGFAQQQQQRQQQR